jgi:hypothetical protein
MSTTYNTGKVQIGLLCRRPMPAIHGDALLLQSALLERRTARPLSRLQRLLGKVWQWL